MWWKLIMKVVSACLNRITTVMLNSAPKCMHLQAQTKKLTTKMQLSLKLNGSLNVQWTWNSWAYQLENVLERRNNFNRLLTSKYGSNILLCKPCSHSPRKWEYRFFVIKPHLIEIHLNGWDELSHPTYISLIIALYRSRRKISFFRL